MLSELKKAILVVFLLILPLSPPNSSKLKPLLAQKLRLNNSLKLPVPYSL
jgi:hypothetical protein